MDNDDELDDELDKEMDEFLDGLAQVAGGGKDAIRQHFNRYLSSDEQKDLQAFSQFFTPVAMKIASNIVIGIVIMSAGSQLDSEAILKAITASAMSGANIYRDALEKIDPEILEIVDQYVKDTGGGL